MKLIGEEIRLERIKQNFDLDKVSKELNISKDILQSIEKDNIPNYLKNVFVIGHIRSYAKFLKLDENELIINYKIQTSYKKNEDEKKISKPTDILNFTSYTKYLSFASIVVLASGFYFLFIKSNNFQNEYAMTPDVPENLQYKIEETEMEIALLNKNENLIELEEIENITSSSAVASLPNNEDKNNLSGIVNLKFLNSTWIQLKDNKNNIIISKLMNPGEEYSYAISKNLSLTAGNAGNIVISINNIVKGKAGKLGQVLESLKIDKNFTN